MVLVRRYRRRRVFRKRRTFRRRPQIARRRFGTSKVYNFKRTAELANFSISAGAGFSAAAYAFQLGNLPSVSEFTTLFDEFRINAVKVTFYPSANVSWVSGSSATPPLGELYTVIDYNSADVPSSVNDMLKYMTLRRTFFNRPHSRYFKPRAVVTGVSDSATSNGGRMCLPHRSWFDCNTGNVRYYGLIVGWAESSSIEAVAQLVRVTCTFYIQFRQVR